MVISAGRGSLPDLVGGPRCSGCRVAAGPLCRACRTKIAAAVERPPPRPVSRLVVPWAYDGPVRSLVLDLKLRAARAAADPLVDAMAVEVWRRGLIGALLTWVPANRRDNGRRGYDHAEILARGLGIRLGLPAAPLLARSREALDQAGLGAKERRRNLDRAFAAQGCPG
ncbi:MAG: ComF family protein, partial [Actinomycetota bacterium]|nr:ComF family protein [Actinomycetota bacterium]